MMKELVSLCHSDSKHPDGRVVSYQTSRWSSLWQTHKHMSAPQPFRLVWLLSCHKPANQTNMPAFWFGHFQPLTVETLSSFGLSALHLLGYKISAVWQWQGRSLSLSVILFHSGVLWFRHEFRSKIAYLHCALSSTAQCIVISPVCGFVGVFVGLLPW